MSDFAIGIDWEILLRLPAESLYRFRAVCKRWRATIDDDRFVKAHTNNQLSSNSTTIIIRNSTGPPFYPFYYIDLEALNFVTNSPQTISVIPLKSTRTGLSCLPDLPVAVCNGLLLIAPKYHRNEADDWGCEGTWEVWNPLSQDRLKLPQPNINSFVVGGYGLGYDCATDDYKVVMIDKNEISTRQTHVYSLKLGLWKNIGNCPFETHGRGVFQNGSLHWVLDDGIFALDVVTEKYRKLALPSFETRPASLQLDALSGCLFLSCNKHQEPYLDVWVMNDYEGKDLWMKLFSLNIHHSRLVAYMKNRNCVLLNHFGAFTLFDVESMSTKTINIHGIYEISISAQVCVGSLFRLHDRVAASKRGKTRKRKMADTKLTFCVREMCRPAHRSSHDDCYSNWHHSLTDRDKVGVAASFDPDGDSATLSVPLDICREIFLRLPAKPLIRFRVVCKTWRAVINDPVFVKAHTNKQLSSNTIVIRNSTGPPFSPLYSFNLEDLNLTNGLQAIAVTPLNFTHSGLSLLPAFPVAACNGLIVVAREIWNPLTHERLELPPGNCEYSNCKEEVIGLGYDEARDDYKVVAIHRHRLHCGEEEELRTYVYSLRSDLWINIGNFPCENEERWQCPKGPGVFLCGALHWPLLYSPNVTGMIIALDLGGEIYRKVQAPPLRIGLNVQKRNLDVLGGCLVASDYVKSMSDGYEKDQFDVWVMKDYGDGDSWIKLFSYSFLISNIRPVAYMMNKTQILLQHDWRGFFLFDVESNSMREVGIHGLSRISGQIIPGSIFRLHDNCGVNGRSRTKESKREMKMHNDTKLYFCALGYRDSGGKHDICYSRDSNWDYLSSEDEC